MPSRFCNTHLPRKTGELRSAWAVTRRIPDVGRRRRPANNQPAANGIISIPYTLRSKSPSTRFGATRRYVQISICVMWQMKPTDSRRVRGIFFVELLNRQRKRRIKQDRFIQWHWCAPCNPAGFHNHRSKLTARRERLLYRSHPSNGKDPFWPSADRFALPNLPFSATNPGPSASGKSRPIAVPFEGQLSGGVKAEYS